jgi:hypothetical protein
MYVSDTPASDADPHDSRRRAEQEKHRVFDAISRLRTIEQDRDRELAALELVRLARSGRTRSSGLPVRRHVGRLFLRVGLWLVIGGTTEPVGR